MRAESSAIATRSALIGATVAGRGRAAVRLTAPRGGSGGRPRDTGEPERSGRRAARSFAREGDRPSPAGGGDKEPPMFNPMRPELALTLHRERVDEGLRRAALSSGKPPDPRRRRAPPPPAEVAYGVNRHRPRPIAPSLRDGAPSSSAPSSFSGRRAAAHSCAPVNSRAALTDVGHRGVMAERPAPENDPPPAAGAAAAAPPLGRAPRRPRRDGRRARHLAERSSRAARPPARRWRASPRART